MDDGVRWSPYVSHLDDHGMQSHHVQDYNPYEVDGRHAARSGHLMDMGQSSRLSEEKNSLHPNEQQLMERRKAIPSAVSHRAVRREGPNWILIAGGAIVTAIGFIIVRRQRPAVLQPKAVVNAIRPVGKNRVQQSDHSFVTTQQESTGSRTSELSTDSPFSGDPFLLARTQSQALSESSRVGSDWGDDPCDPLSPPASPRTSYYSQLAPRPGGNQSNRTSISPTSPPGSYRGADTSATECNDPVQLSPPARLGFSSRRDMVHRLRQQLKSRDEMILDMQAQFSDQERTICLQQAHCQDLEKRLEDTCRTLQESDLEVQRLRKAVAEYLTGQTAAEELASSAGSAQQTHDNFLIREAGRLAEELRQREDETEELVRIANVKAREHQEMMQKLHSLEAELDQAQKSNMGKDLLLEAYEVEQENLEVKFDNMRQLIQAETPEKTPMSCKIGRSPGSSRIGRQSLSGGSGLLRADRRHNDSMHENGNFNSEDMREHARNVVRSCSALFEGDSEQSGVMDGGAANGRPKTDESSSNGDISEESESEDLSAAVSEKLVMKLREEVEQLSFILADHSNTMSEKRLETSRLVDEFQKYNALIDDTQKRMDEDAERTPESREHILKNQSKYRSSSDSDDASASQVQELRHKLEQIANQQRVEEEIGDLSKYQVKISELKQRVEKLLKNCKHIQQSNGSSHGSGHQQASKIAEAGFQLAKQLDLQEEQARRTSREVQRLLASFELSSPYVPRSKKEELRKLLQCPEPFSPPVESGSPGPVNESLGEPSYSYRFRIGSEVKPIESDVLFDREIYVSSAELADSQSRVGPSLPAEEDYVHRLRFALPSVNKLGREMNSRSETDKSPEVRKRVMARATQEGAPMESEREAARNLLNTCLDDVRLDGRVSETSFEHSEKTEEASELDFAPGALSLRRTSPAGSRVTSCDSFSDLSTVRKGNARHADQSNSIDNDKGSFGKFLFEMETGEDRVYAIDKDDANQQEIVCGNASSSPLSPRTKIIMAKLDLRKTSPPSEVAPETPTAGEKGSAVDDGSAERRRSRSSSPDSIDSCFDALLSNTLDELVRVCSTPNTPADAPDSFSLV